jgi:hypothetical protein
VRCQVAWCTVADLMIGVLSRLTSRQGHGDISTGRPEDSNLGWGMAEPAGTKYIWISMPFVSADLGNLTEVSTYWWGCPSSDASRPCGDAFNIGPTIKYLHSALQQAFDRFNADPERVVVTGAPDGRVP